MNIFKHRTSVDKTEKVVAPPSSENQQKSTVEKIITLKYSEDVGDSGAFVSPTITCTLGEFIDAKYKIIVPIEEYEEYCDRDCDEVVDGVGYVKYKDSNSIGTIDCANIRLTMYDDTNVATEYSVDSMFSDSTKIDSNGVLFNIETYEYKGEGYDENNTLTLYLKKSDKVQVCFSLPLDASWVETTIHPLFLNLRSV